MSQLAGMKYSERTVIKGNFEGMRLGNDRLCDVEIFPGQMRLDK